MNKLLLTALVTGSLLLLDSPEAAAHGNGHDKYARSDAHYSRSYDRDYRQHRGHHYSAKYKRPKHMPYRLKHDRQFRRWFKRTHFRADRRLSWNRLFDIYVYEQRYSRHDRRH